MIQRVEHANGVVTYQSDLLRGAGVPHTFSTRMGGVSKPPYDTLNLGYLTKGDAVPDDNTNISENFRRLRSAVGLERRWRAQANQIHGSNVYVPKEPKRLRECPQADAIVTDLDQAMPTVRTADCVPVLLASEDGRVVAAVHAGWRGIVAGVVQEAVETMRDRFQIASSKLLAAIGPAISARHYEVGNEVIDAFVKADLSGSVLDGFGTKKHVDLADAVVTQLERAGLGDIDRTNRCTFEHADEFFSYRRDGGTTGHLAAVIAPRVAGADLHRKQRRASVSGCR